MIEQANTAPVAVRVDTAAHMLDASPSTILFWLRSGKLRGTKVGRAWLIRVADINALVGAETSVTQ